MRKILVIDDHDPWCDNAALELQRAGHEVVRARDEAQAVAAASDQSPSLVLVDLLVAAKAGAGFVRRLRSLPSMKNTPLLLTTAGTNRQAAQHALGQAADQIIPKNKHSMDIIIERLMRLPKAD